MTFDVDVPRLAVVPFWLEELAEDADRCARYADAAFDFDLGAGSLNRGSVVHAEVRETVSGFFSTIANQARRLSTSIDKCVRDYEAVDLQTAASFDARVPTVDRPDWTRLDTMRTDIPQANGRPLNEPANQLKTLIDYRPEWPYEPQWADLFSPANICRDTLMGVNWLAVQVGIADRIYDPMDNLAVPWFGNWAGMKACSDALRNVSAACSDLQNNCEWIELRVTAIWQGNAADAAWMQLWELGNYIKTAIAPLDHFSAAYAEVVDEMAKLEEIMEIVIGEAIDYAVLAVVAASTSWTGVGLILAETAVAVKIIMTIAKVQKAITLIDALGISVDVFTGKVDGSWGGLQVDFETAG